MGWRTLFTIQVFVEREGPTPNVAYRRGDSYPDRLVAVVVDVYRIKPGVKPRHGAGVDVA